MLEIEVTVILVIGREDGVEEGEKDNELEVM